MATPYPAPTPWQPSQLGGNANVPQGLIGPSVPGNFIGPIQQPKGATYMNNASTAPGVKSSSLSQTPNKSGSTSSTSSGQVQGLSTNNSNGAGGQPQTPSTYAGAGDSGNYSFGSEQDFYKAIDEAYNPQYDYLNQVEGTLKSQFPSVLQDAEESYKANVGQLDVGKQSSLNQIGQSKQQTTSRYEDALSATRRMYDEMQRGYGARFGGSSSAGEAANTLLGVEAQRQRGQTQRGYNDTMSQMAVQEQEVEKGYQANLQQLTAQKTQAVNQAQRDFQNKLLEISNNRSMLGQAKAQAKLGALQELRQQVYAIDMQNRQFEQQLNMMKEQSKLQIQQYNATSGGNAANASKALEAFNNSGLDPSSGLRYEQGKYPSQRLTDPIYIGQIGKSISGRDELGRTVYDDGSKGWSQWQ